MKEFDLFIREECENLVNRNRGLLITGKTFSAYQDKGERRFYEGFEKRIQTSNNFLGELNLETNSGVSVVLDQGGFLHITRLNASGQWETKEIKL